MISINKQTAVILFFSIFLLSGACDALAQRDSLYNVINATGSDSIRINCYKHLSRYYLDHKKFDSAVIASDKGLELARKIDMAPDIEFFQLKVRAYDALMQYRKALDQYSLIIEALEKSTDPDDAVRLTLNQGWQLFRQGEFTKSIESFEEARIAAQERYMQKEVADAYLGLGRVYYNLKDMDLEALYYEKYLELVDMDKEKYLVFYILTRLGDIMREQEKYEEGIDIYHKLIALSKEVGDSLRVANTLNRIAWGYYQMGDLENSLKVYQECLDLSKELKQKNLIANSYGNMGNIYRDWNYYEKAIEYYNLSIEVAKEVGDIYNLTWLYKDISAMYANMERYQLAYENSKLHSAYNDTLMSEDYSRRLVEAQTRYEREKSEKEIALMEIRLQRNNYLLYGLGGLSLLVVVFAILFIRNSRLRARQRMEDMNHRISELNQKNLRTQMNPHFIFNTLNSIQYYVFQNDRISSNNYMTKFAKLIRKTLENSEHPAIPIQEEIDALELYLELESLRFKKKFEWTIDIDEEIDTYMYKIPTMLIQPFVENAIGHGLMHKDGKGFVNIALKLGDSCIHCSIEDNGVGRAKAMEIKNGKKENHRSLGTSITETRLRLVNSLYGKNMKVKYTDLKDDEGNASGTKVEICIPIIT